MVGGDDPLAQLPWEYRYQPVMPLYLFNRPQDAAFRKSRSTLNERNQLRLWLSTHTYRDQPVWVGQISRDIGVRITSKSPTLTTHKIDPDVDETRGFLVQELWYSQGLEQFALVRRLGAAPLTTPRTNLTGAPYFTDGLRAVLWVSSDPVPFERVQFVEWEQPPGK